MKTHAHATSFQGTKVFIIFHLVKDLVKDVYQVVYVTINFPHYQKKLSKCKQGNHGIM